MGLEQEVPRVQVGTSVVIPVVVLFVHPSDDGVRGRIGSRGETSSAASSGMVGCGHAGNDAAMEVAMSPVTSLEISGHYHEGRSEGGCSFPRMFVFFYTSLIVPLVSFSHWSLLR